MSEQTASAKKTVEFWFDPVCPWTWITSRWMVEVAEARSFDVLWQPFSLKILNEGNASDGHAEIHQTGYRLGRLSQAIFDEHGAVALGKWYTAVGERTFPGRRDDVDAIMTESLEEAGLSAELFDSVDAGELVGDATDAIDAGLRENTHRGLDLVGPGVGVPIIAIDEVAFFGPVVSPAPTGDDALRLWDAFSAAASVPGFYEIKRGRTVGPQF